MTTKINLSELSRVDGPDRLLPLVFSEMRLLIDYAGVGGLNDLRLDSEVTPSGGRLLHCWGTVRANPIGVSFTLPHDATSDIARAAARVAARRLLQIVNPLPEGWLSW